MLRALPRMWASLVSQTVKNSPVMQETQVQFLGQEDPLENGMATHSRVLAWRSPWTEGLRGLQYLGLQLSNFHSLIAPRMWMLSQATSLSFRISTQTSTRRSSIFPTGFRTRHFQNEQTCKWSFHNKTNMQSQAMK